MDKELEKCPFTHFDPDSKYAEFDYNGIRFYLSPLDPTMAYGLDEPEMTAMIAKVDFEEQVVYIKGMFQL